MATEGTIRRQTINKKKLLTRMFFKMINLKKPHPEKWEVGNFPLGPLV